MGRNFKKIVNRTIARRVSGCIGTAPWVIGTVELDVIVLPSVRVVLRFGHHAQPKIEMLAFQDIVPSSHQSPRNALEPKSKEETLLVCRGC